MRIIQNFEWAELDDKALTIFIPNYGRGDYIRRLIEQFQTKASVEMYTIVVGNDGLHDDFSDLYPKNVRYFTLGRKDPNISRNGCFIRNYFIKRCKSRNIFSKDPETEIRPMNADSPTDWILDYCRRTGDFVRPQTTLSLGTGEAPQSVIPGVSHRFHWGFLAPTEALRELRGYNEQFTGYGYEDTEFYEVLLHKVGTLVLDKNVMVVHHPHPVESKVYHEVNDMARVYSRLSRDPMHRNICGWGEG